MNGIDLHIIGDRLRQVGLLGEIRGHARNAISGCTADSRAVVPSSLFVAIRGARFDGHRFIDQAIQQGAAAIICEDPPEAKWPAGVAMLLVSDSGAALGHTSSLLAGDPSHGLRMVGVTGTNGKTTTAWLIAQAMTALGTTCGFIGTIGQGIPPDLTPTRHTTPDAPTLHLSLREGLSSAWEGCAMEVSSHALSQCRTAGVSFDAAVFTNLTRDHLDYHGTMASYAAAKALLFESLTPSDVMVLNRDDPNAAAVAGRSEARPIWYGSMSRDVDVAYRVERDTPSGLRLTLDGKSSDFRLAGTFNAGNLAAAYATLVGLGLPAEESLKALAASIPAPGRFEPIPLTTGVTAVVDYAHTPDALSNVLRAARRSCTGLLWCVFGCGGDRDTGKRPEMGRIAESLADRVVLTSDNPRSEDPERILDDILKGFVRPAAAMRIADRADAIRAALELASPGDLVLVAGKGHENYQVLADRTIAFDDREAILQTTAA